MDYLNRLNRERALVLCEMVGLLGGCIEDLEQYGKPATDLRHARTRIERHLDNTLGGLPEDEIRKLVGQAERMG